MHAIHVSSTNREQMIDITRDVEGAIKAAGIARGVVVVYCPHTTAGIAVNEAADPDVPRDILVGLRELAPRHGDYLHAEGNSDAHLKASLIGPSVLIPVEDAKLALGRWQGVFFCEFDGPRSRTVVVQALQGRTEK